ncbi:MAG TPA: thioesterase family protein [Myxococcota bacterium]|nr:thioesterase family protein [Myxococcota bacterium]HQK50843.1 thioesterase family protein [Myxococcota bacterium]
MDRPLSPRTRPPRPPRLAPRPGAQVAEVPFRVPFHDVDAMQVVWHGHYVKYFELARTELERRMGLGHQELLARNLVCPVVDLQCRYLSPLRLGHEARVRAFIVEADRSLWIAYEVVDDTTRRKAAEGYTVQVALTADTFELVMELPDDIVDRARMVAGLPALDRTGPGR